MNVDKNLAVMPQILEIPENENESVHESVPELEKTIEIE